MSKGRRSITNALYSSSRQSPMASAKTLNTSPKYSTRQQGARSEKTLTNFYNFPSIAPLLTTLTAKLFRILERKYEHKWRALTYLENIEEIGIVANVFTFNFPLDVLHHTDWVTRRSIPLRCLVEWEPCDLFGLSTNFWTLEHSNYILPREILPSMNLTVPYWKPDIKLHSRVTNLTILKASCATGYPS
jgi:hypothetical protein